MNIRKIEKADLSQLSDLYYQFWNEHSDIAKMEKQLELIVAENNHIILVCENNDNIVGSVMGIVCRELYGDCSPFLVVENMIVDFKFRRKGIGKKLLAHIESCAKKRNCTQMILVTEQDRHDACGFYENFGFSKNTTGYKKKIL